MYCHQQVHCYTRFPPGFAGHHDFQSISSDHITLVKMVNDISRNRVVCHTQKCISNYLMYHMTTSAASNYVGAASETDSNVQEIHGISHGPQSLLVTQYHHVPLFFVWTKERSPQYWLTHIHIYICLYWRLIYVIWCKILKSFADNLQSESWWHNARTIIIGQWDYFTPHDYHYVHICHYSNLL